MISTKRRPNRLEKSSRGIAHLSVDQQTALQDQERFDAEVCRFVDDDVSQLARLDATDVVGDAVGDRRVDCVLGNVPLDALVVVAVAVALRRAELLQPEDERLVEEIAEAVATVATAGVEYPLDAEIVVSDSEEEPDG